ncbi:MAG: hypothetical protein EOO03_03800 [Chitinophagaceae bacterium]|nr:MAG: hypothetical protein EOO03_03800 [Chitinophagaceae bacterium]
MAKPSSITANFSMEAIFIYDYLILIPYLIIFFLLARSMAKQEEPRLRPYMMTAFWLRMLGCVLYSMIMQYYYGYGDSFTYFKGSNFFTSKISEDPGNIHYLFASAKDIAEWYKASPESDFAFSGYFTHPSGNMVMRVSAFLSYVSFNRFLIISLFFAFFSFVGQWRMFRVFDDINKKQRTGLMAIAVLYSPSLWFWGSGLLKDSLCLGGLGCMVYILYNAIEKRKLSPWNVIAFLAIFYCVAVIKSYITNILLISIVFTMAFVFIQKINNYIIRIGLLLFIILISFVGLSLIDISSQINDLVEDAVMQINAYQQNYETVSAEMEDSKGGFTMKAIDPSLSTIIKRAPGVVLSCLYRPFLWESRKIIILFTSLESTVLLYCTLYLLFKGKIVGFFKPIFAERYMFFSFTLSILFALIIGFTTFNFGTMIRYKIIFLPFFYFMLVRLYTILKNGKAQQVSLHAQDIKPL